MAKQIIFRGKAKRAAGIAKEAWESGLRSIAREVKAETQALVSKPYPPASKPLQPPHKRSGKLQSGITVVVEKATRGRAAALVVKSDQDYGAFLERGTRKMIRRPFGQVVLTGSRRKTTLSKKWQTKIARAAKRKAATAANKGKRRR
jgi:hypothetical protein